MRIARALPSALEGSGLLRAVRRVLLMPWPAEGDAAAGEGVFAVGRLRLRQRLVRDPPQQVGCVLPPLGQRRAMPGPLPDPRAGDLGGRRVLHQVVDRRGAVAPQPGLDVLDADADV